MNKRNKEFEKWLILHEGKLKVTEVKEHLEVEFTMANGNKHVAKLPPKNIDPYAFNAFMNKVLEAEIGN